MKTVYDMKFCPCRPLKHNFFFYLFFSCHHLAAPMPGRAAPVPGLLAWLLCQRSDPLFLHDLAEIKTWRLKFLGFRRLGRWWVTDGLKFSSRQSSRAFRFIGKLIKKLDLWGYSGWNIRLLLDVFPGQVFFRDLVGLFFFIETISYVIMGVGALFRNVLKMLLGWSQCIVI